MIYGVYCFLVESLSSWVWGLATPVASRHALEG